MVPRDQTIKSTKEQERTNLSRKLNERSHLAIDN
jgi:hypothetical protein